MEEEVDLDARHGTLYLSPRLSQKGREDYTSLLREAVRTQTDDWLAVQLAKDERLEAMEVRNTRSGPVTAKVPWTAAQTLAESEFNRFYVRGVCIVALENGKGVVVYRAKIVSDPRPQSEALIGTSVEPQRLLQDLRARAGVETALGVPAGPNSGLSVHVGA